MIRKITVLVLIFFLLLSLNGCIYFEVDRKYELQYDISDITEINIYVDSERTGYPPDTPHVQLPPDSFTDFTADLKELPFTDGYLIILAAVDPSFTFGYYTVEIIYADSGYELISNHGYQEYRDNAGIVRGRHYSCDDEVWEAFILKYFSSE